MSCSAPWLTGPLLFEVWMNAGTVSQLNLGPLQEAHTGPAATLVPQAVVTSAAISARRQESDAMEACVSVQVRLLRVLPGSSQHVN